LTLAESIGQLGDFGNLAFRDRWPVGLRLTPQCPVMALHVITWLRDNR